MKSKIKAIEMVERKKIKHESTNDQINYKTNQTYVEICRKYQFKIILKSINKSIKMVARKKIKNESTNEYARWFVAVKTDATFGSYDMGDSYIAEATYGLKLDYASPEFNRGRRQLLASFQCQQWHSNLPQHLNQSRRWHKCQHQPSRIVDRVRY